LFLKEILCEVFLKNFYNKSSATKGLQGKQA